MIETSSEVAAKAIVYAAVLAAIGVEAVRWGLLPRLHVSPAVELAAYERGLGRTLVAVSVAVVLGLGLRVWTHTIAAFGFAEAQSLKNLVVVAVESRWGQGWRLQVAAGALLLIVATVSQAMPGMKKMWRALTVVALCVAVPMTGHAAGHPARVAGHAVHVFGAGLWIGTLAIVVAGRSDEAVRLQPQLLRAFAPLAMTGMTALALSGAIAAWQYLGPVANLWHTPYGRLLSAKLALVCGAAALGAANWWRLHKSERPVSRHRVALEVGVAAVVILLTAWLTETAHPGS